jgi:AGCS family alanine or glycine:cation symporter
MEVLLILLFAFATIIGWFYIAKSSVDYLNVKPLKKSFDLLYPIFCVFGSVLSLDAVFTLSDTINGILAILNTCAIVFLSKNVFSEFKKFHIAKPFADNVKENSDKNS